MKSTLFALLLALLLPAMTEAAPAQSKPSSFKSGFSSQRAAPTSAGRSAPKASPSFGAFGGARNAGQQRSDSVLSQRLDKAAAEAKALRTLDARRAAAQARKAAPLPPAATYESHVPAPAPIVVQRDSSGLGNVVTGVVLGRAMSNGHAHQSAGSGNEVAAPSASTGSFFGTMLRIFAWLAILALLAWGCWFIWRYLRRGRAASTANYSFER